MSGGSLLKDAREAAGLTAGEVARRAATSRTAISAYEHGRKSPTLDTAARLLQATGHQLTITPQREQRIGFQHRMTADNRPLVVPDRLPRLEPARALRSTRLPRHLNWSGPDRIYQLADRGDRARVYRAVLVEGNDRDILEFIDATLLVDSWDELRLPTETRQAWQPLIDNVLTLIQRGDGYAYQTRATT